MTELALIIIGCTLWVMIVMAWASYVDANYEEVEDDEDDGPRPPWSW